MKIIVRLILCLTSGVSSATSYANASSLSPDTIATLAQAPQWQQLLLLNSNGKSKLTDGSFYLAHENQSPDATISTLAELEATLAAYAKPIDDPNQHALCAYPGRRAWLNQSLPDYFTKYSKIDCPDFEAFKKNKPVSSISLIFATGYLGNPASYYGHLLLKLNTSEYGQLHDPAVNFGADVPLEDDMLSYIVKGLVGGYQSSFTTQGFFYHIQNYGENELRDLWEYELDLTSEQKMLFSGHLWELQNRDFTYYFLNKNCAFFMADALNLVANVPVSKKWRPWVAPQTVIQQLMIHNPWLIKSKRYHPSRQSRLYQRYSALDSRQREVVANIANNPSDLEFNAINELHLSSQQQILDTLIDYFQFLRDPSKGLDDPNNTYYNLVLAQRYKLPAGQPRVTFISENFPELGRNVSRLAFGVKHTDSDTISTISIRPAYYDPLDATYGHTSHSGLSMGEVTGSIKNEQLSIDEIKLVDILSISRNYTSLPGDQNHSWYLVAGAKRKEQHTPLASFAAAGYGLAQSYSKDKLNAAAFIGVGFHDTKLTTQGIYISATATVNAYITSQWSWNIKAEHRHYQSYEEQQVDTTLRYAFGANLDSRLTWNYNSASNSNSIALQMGWYW